MAVEFAAWEEPVDDKTQIVAVRGEVDIFTAPEFKTLISNAIEAGRDTVIVDLAEATFIDSSSLGVLISAHRRLGLRDGGRLIIASEVREVRKTFTITGLDSVFEIVDTREQALAASKGPPSNEEAA